MKHLLPALLFVAVVTLTSSCSTKAERLGKYLDLKLAWFDVFTYPLNSKQNIRVEGSNKANTAIKAIKGRLIITDLFGRELRSFDLVIDDPIAPNDIFMRSVLFDYDPANPEHTRLSAKTFSQVKAIWEPDKILFADGTVLE